jgi:hypothetical protein
MSENEQDEKNQAERVAREMLSRNAAGAPPEAEPTQEAKKDVITRPMEEGFELPDDLATDNSVDGSDLGILDTIINSGTVNSSSTVAPEDEEFVIQEESQGQAAAPFESTSDEATAISAASSNDSNDEVSEFIKETSKEETEDASTEEIRMEAAKVDIRAGGALEFYDNIEDLSKLSVVESNKAQRVVIVDSVATNKAAYQVIALKSGYVAHMSALSNKDRETLKNSNLGVFETRMKLFTTIHEKLVSTSIGNLTFEQFTEITAVEDLDTLIFGVFAQTYPGDTKINIRCAKCGKSSEVGIKPNQFVQIRDKSVYEYVKDVTRQKLTPSELVKQSLVHKTERIQLPDSRIVVEITTPTLQDSAKLLAKYDAEKLGPLTGMFGMLMYVSKMFVPHVTAAQRTSKPVYTPLEGYMEIFDALLKLSDNDSAAMDEAFARRSKKFDVRYSVKSFPCPKCKKDIGDIPLDLEELLFFRVGGRGRTSTES